MPTRIFGPPNPVKTVSDLNGAIPTVWDAGWQIYTDLSKEQIAAFQAMPEWQAFVADHADWVQSKVGPAPSLTVNTIKTNALRAGALNRLK